jgi:hypothetical protein
MFDKYNMHMANFADVIVSGMKQARVCSPAPTFCSPQVVVYYV